MLLAGRLKVLVGGLTVTPDGWAMSSPSQQCALAWLLPDTPLAVTAGRPASALLEVHDAAGTPLATVSLMPPVSLASREGRVCHLCSR